MNELVSIIIPVYNVEKYIEKCINSALKQNYDNLEIILVDDGSTDDSGKICDVFQSKNPNKIFCYHKKNGGLSDARNYGLKHSNGKYVVFVDSDDWIEENTISEAYKEIILNKADIAIYGIKIDNDNGTIKSRTPSKKEILTSDEGIIYLNSFKGIDVSACNKMFNRKIFNNIEFPKGKLCEDYYIMYKLFGNANKIVIIPQAFYHYYQRQNSIVRNTKINMDYIYAAKEEMDYLNSHNKNIAFAGKTGYAFAMITLYHVKYSRKVSLDKKETIAEIKKYQKDIINNKFLPTSRKIQYIVFVHMNWLYDIWLTKKVKKVW